jgi:phenylpyruvate tautomerase PptA (4-oxalocrotonate tautomerase family)
MPTYTVISVEGCLDATKRAKIASEITRIHSKTTGAPTYFAQVIFTEIAPDCYFVGGGPLKGHQVFVNGQIRAGRSAESKDSLIAQITAAVAEASNLSKRNVWVYITDLVPRQMVEFGHVLPEAGDEAHWAAALPEADRAHMQSFALQH